MTHNTCRPTAKNRDQLRNPTIGNRVWATFFVDYSDTVTKTPQGTGRTSEAGCAEAAGLSRLRCRATLAIIVTGQHSTDVYLFLTLHSFADTQQTIIPVVFSY